MGVFWLMAKLLDCGLSQTGALTLPKCFVGNTTQGELVVSRVLAQTMNDFLKDVVATLNGRLRSHFFGSAFLAFVGTNWKVLFYLFFADRPVRAKFLFFDENTDAYSLLVVPVLIGLIIAMASPWIKLFGAYIATLPTRKLVGLQDAEKIKRQINELTLLAEKEDAVARLEKASEIRKIEAAKRLEEAAEVTAEVKQEIVADREKKIADQTDSDVKESTHKDLELNDVESLAIIALGQWNGGIPYASNLAKDKAIFNRASRVIPNLTEKRLEIELENALERLQKLGYATSSMAEWQLTKKGYLRYDELIGK